MKVFKRLVFISFLLFFTSACSKVGALVSNTGDFVSKTGDIIGGNNTPKKSRDPVVTKRNNNLNNIKNKKISNSRKPYKPRAYQSPTITVNINTTQSANLSKSGKPSRIKVTMLQLKSIGKFSSSRISALQNNLESTLGGDFISQESVSLLPEKGKIVKIAINPSTKVLGVFASFKQLNNTIWKTNLNIPNARGSYNVQVIVDSKKITSKRK